MKVEMKQWNTRIRGPYKKAAKLAAAAMDTTLDGVAEYALAVLVGEETHEIQMRREKAIKAYRGMGEKLPFELPLTPITDDAHNGIVGVASSNLADSTSRHNSCDSGGNHADSLPKLRIRVFAHEKQIRKS